MSPSAPALSSLRFHRRSSSGLPSRTRRSGGTDEVAAPGLGRLRVAGAGRGGGLGASATRSKSLQFSRFHNTQPSSRRMANATASANESPSGGVCRIAAITRLFTASAATASTPLYSGAVQNPRNTAHCSKKCRRNEGSRSCRWSKGAAVRYLVPTSGSMEWSGAVPEAPAVLSSLCVSKLSSTALRDLTKWFHPEGDSRASGGFPKNFWSDQKVS